MHFDGQGPDSGFRGDGTAIEFVADAEAGTLALWDLAKLGAFCILFRFLGASISASFLNSA